MPNLHIIIGDSNTRKSSLLRCLTGVGSGNATRNLDICESSGKIITVHCILSALQENYKPLLPAEFIKHIQTLESKPSDIAFTLRVSSRGNYPPASAYLNAFSKIGWPVINVALLGPSACAQGAAIVSRSICRVIGSPTQPTNKTAAQVRKNWKWQ